MKLIVNQKSIDLTAFTKKYSKGISGEKFCDFINQHNLGISAKVDEEVVVLNTKPVFNSMMNTSTPEAKAFWEHAIRRSKEAELWPAWKRSL
jgi:hypothetical protein